LGLIVEVGEYGGYGVGRW